jgi:hypothetical protein
MGYTADFKPKTQDDMLEYFLARHNALELSKAKKKAQEEAPKQPLTKRELFRQFFESKARRDEDEIRDIKASDYFPLYFEPCPPEPMKKKRKKKNTAKTVPSAGQKAKAKRKPKSKRVKAKPTVLKAASKPKAKGRSKGKKKPKKKLAEADEEADMLHDVTALSSEPDSNMKTLKKRKAKVKKSSKVKVKGKVKRKGKRKKKLEPKVPKNLLKIMDKLCETEIASSDHDVGESNNGLLEPESDKLESCVDKAPNLEEKKIEKKVTFTPAKSGRSVKRSEAVQKKADRDVNKAKLGKKLPISSKAENDSEFNRIWVEVSGPSYQMEAFSEDIFLRLSRAPPGSNLSLTHLFSSEEMSFRQQQATALPDGDQQQGGSQSPALLLSPSSRGQQSPGLFVFPLDVYQEGFSLARRSSSPIRRAESKWALSPKRTTAEVRFCLYGVALLSSSDIYETILISQ